MSNIANLFEEATRDGILIKAALTGAPGSGKTWTALALASYLSTALDLGPVYLIDSENRSSKKYVYNPKTGEGWKFRASYMPEDDYSPQTYMQRIRAAEQAGAKMIIIDSLSHAWAGPRGILEQVDEMTVRAAQDRGKQYGNSFSDGWRKATPLQNEFIQTILGSPAHILATMRSDPEWVLDGNSPKKVGMAPKQRKDITFEFDVVLDFDHDNTCRVDKTRCSALGAKGGIFKKPNVDKLGAILADWVRSSDDAPPPVVPLDKAINEAVEMTRGVAPDQKAATWARAKKHVTDFCRTRGMSSEEAAAAVATLGQKAAALNGNAQPTGAPTGQV
jgi:hypothetical protein